MFSTENKMKNYRHFLFKNRKSGYSKSIFFQLFFAAILLVLSISLSTLLFKHFHLIDLERFYNDFIIYFKLTVSSLYLMLINLISIILVIVSVLLAIFLNITSTFRIIKTIKFFINSKKYHNNYIFRKSTKY